MPTPGNYAHVRRTAPQHITWKRIRTYTTTYTPTGRKPKTQRQMRNAVILRSVTRPKKVRYFRTGTGLKKFHAASTQSTIREVIIVAKTKSRKKPVDAEEIEEIEAIEELDELEDDDLEDEVDEEEPDEEEDEDEDEDDEDEAPPKRKKSQGKDKTSTKTKKPAQSRAAANGKIGTQELAQALGVDGRTLRIVLRKHNIQKDPESNRYEWDSMEDKEVKKIAKLIASGEAKRAKEESLNKLKEKKAAQREEAQNASKKGKGKRSKVAETEVVDEDDEVEDDDIEEEEDEEPTPAPKRKKSKK